MAGSCRRTSLRPAASAVLVLGIGLVFPRVAEAQVYGTTLSGEDDALFGSPIVNVGDVDGDGVDDLLVGEPDHANGTHPEVGRASLYSGATMAWIRDHDGTVDYDHFGFSMAAAGDVDGDGVPDYAVGSPDLDAYGYVDNGGVVVYSGATGQILWLYYGVGGEQLGYAICGVDSLDGSGRPNLLASEIVFGSVTVFDHVGTNLYFVGGNGDHFGAALAKGGDLDGDGVPDWFAGAPLEDAMLGGVLNADVGAVYAISGANYQIIYRIGGVKALDRLGMALAPVGDLDGDGIPDVMVGAPLSMLSGTEQGYAILCSGKTGAPFFADYGGQDYQHLGASVAGVPDMNHDGVPDFAIGAPGYVNFFVTRGFVKVISGKDFKGLVTWIGDGSFNTGNHALGTSIAGGDWNGDGIGDMVIGDPYDVVKYSDRTIHQVGAAYEYLGCPAWWENYGSGWPGQNGVPALTALNDPSPGLPLTIQVDSSSGSLALGVLLLGFAEANVATGKGGTLLVSPAQTIPLAIPGTGLQMNATIPNDPALDFFDLYLQAIEADAFASKGLSFTAGLRLRFGLDLP